MNSDEIFTFGKLYEAHRQARKCKRHKKDVVSFEMNLSAELCGLQQKLENGSYEIGGYNRFTIYEPKKREIQALSYRDRIIQHALCDNIIAPYLANRLTADNAACQKGKGTHYGIKRLTQQLRKHYKQHGTQGWFLKADIRKYFASIDHGVLKTMLAKEKFDERTLELLNKIIDSYNADTGKGVPMGNQTSQNFALLYLDKIDRYIKERAGIKHYVRYMDDMILTDISKEKLQKTLEGMKVIIKELKLELNEKTQLIPLKNGIDFLGWHFYLTDSGKVIRKLRTHSKKRIYARIKQQRHELERGRMEPEKLKASLMSTFGHLEHGNSEGLKRKILKMLYGGKQTENKQKGEKTNEN